MIRKVVTRMFRTTGGINVGVCSKPYGGSTCIKPLVGSFDYAINEQCFQYSECDDLKEFVQAGKPVFQVEYNKAASSFCPKANSAVWNFNSIKKGADAELSDTPYTPCR